MANIFNEVDEDIRKERYQNLWSKYGKYIIGFLVLIVTIFSLTQYLQSKNTSDNKKILDTYFTAIESIEKNQLDLADQNLKTVYNEKNKTLAAVSSIKLSQVYLEDNQKNQALSLLKDIYSNNSLDSIYRELALYKYIMINFENIEVSNIENMISLIENNNSEFNLYFQEMIGIKHLTLGNTKKANSIFTNLSLDENTPFDLRMRLDKLIQIAN
jgi:hypothetical protein